MPKKDKNTSQQFFFMELQASDPIRLEQISNFFLWNQYLLLDNKVEN